MTVSLYPSKPGGAIAAPPSKSMAHRMLICAALAGGASKIHNVDFSEDIQATITALQALGATIACGVNSVQVKGARLPFAYSGTPVNCRESGSTLRFIIPLFSLTGRQTTFTGAPRLFQRPLTAYAAIFEKQNLVFRPGAESLVLQGPLASGEYTLAGDVSSQFISGLLFALPLLPGSSILRITPPFESRSYVELTRTAQQLFGVESHWEDDFTLAIPGGQQYAACAATVEGDWSQAAVPAVIGAVCGGVSVSGLLPDSAQGDRAILSILQRCGAEMRWENGLLISGPANNALRAAGNIDISDCPDLGPILCTLALFCRGTTRLTNAGRLRIKESDRIAAVEEEFKKLGVTISSTKDTVTVEGGCALLTGIPAASHNDHRIVMALTAAAVCAGIPLQISGAEAVQKSWPGFFASMQALGIQCKMEADT